MRNPSYWRSFRTLGVPPNSNNAAVKKAYKKIAGQHHPDRSPSEESIAIFKEVVEAYDEIMRIRSAPLESKHTIEASIYDVVKGTSMEYEVPLMELCDDCGGSGWEVCSMCSRCQAKGWVSNIFFGQAVCNSCASYGWHGRERCRICHGEGKIRTDTKKVSVTIPPNSWSGRVVFDEDDITIILAMKLVGYGIRGRLLTTSLDVPYEILFKGGKIPVDAPDGEVILKVPPRTKPGTGLLLKELGLPFESGRGDLVVKVGLLFPEEENHNEE